MVRLQAGPCVLNVEVRLYPTDLTSSWWLVSPSACQGLQALNCKEGRAGAKVQLGWACVDAVNGTCLAQAPHSMHCQMPVIALEARGSNKREQRWPNRRPLVARNASKCLAHYGVMASGRRLRR